MSKQIDDNTRTFIESCREQLHGPTLKQQVESLKAERDGLRQQLEEVLVDTEHYNEMERQLEQAQANSAEIARRFLELLAVAHTDRQHPGLATECEMLFCVNARGMIKDNTGQPLLDRLKAQDDRIAKQHPKFKVYDGVKGPDGNWFEIHHVHECPGGIFYSGNGTVWYAESSLRLEPASPPVEQPVNAAPCLHHAWTTVNSKSTCNSCGALIRLEPEQPKPTLEGPHWDYAEDALKQHSTAWSDKRDLDLRAAIKELRKEKP